MRRNGASRGKKASFARLDERFTREERAHLRALRRRFRHVSVSIELGLNPQRLRFARWLVEHGKLGETL